MSDAAFVREKISLDEIRRLAEQRYGDMAKAVVDIKRRVMVVGTEMHADAEQMLLDDGSQQDDLWGINLYQDAFPSDAWIEFDSMINIRPRQNNRSRGVEDAGTQQVIRDILQALVQA